MYPQDLDNWPKGFVIRDETTMATAVGVKGAGSFGIVCLWSGLAPISLLVGSWPTKAMIGSRPERVIGHTGTETLPRLLREAAVANHSQWTQV